MADALLSFALPFWAGDPAMRIQDAYKWLFQAYRGGEHAVRDAARVSVWLDQEWERLGAAQPGEPLAQPLRPDGAIIRLNLRPYRALNGDKHRLFVAFMQSAGQFKPDQTLFQAAWHYLRQQIGVKPIGSLTTAEWEQLDSEVAPLGYPAISHSDTYRQAHQPAYRVLTGEWSSGLIAAAG